MREKKSLRSMGRVFMLVSICLLVGTFFYARKQIRLSREYDKIEATITHVYEGDGCGFKFTYKDRYYEFYQSSYYSNTMRPGKKIEIYVDPYDPYDFEVASGSIVPMIILPVMGIACFFVALTGFRQSRFKKAGKDWKYVHAEVVDVVLNRSLSVNGVCPFQMVCKYVNPSTGEEKLFYSDNCFDDPGMIYRPNEPIKVYVKDETMEEYTVDLSKMSEYKLG